VIFWPDHCVFKDIKTRKTIGCGTKKGRLYYLDLTSSSSSALAQSLSVTSSTSTSNIWLWHKRFGHVSFGYLKHLFPELFLNTSPPLFKCETCELAKSHRVPFHPSLNKSPLPFTLIHSDVWGPAKVPTLNGSRWFVSFIDDHSRMTWVCLMKTKQAVCSLFKQFYSMVATQYKTSIQVLRTDNGGEFVNHEMKQFLQCQGIIHQTTCPYSPQQNGVAERKNRHLLEMVRATLFEANMPLHYWGESLTTASYIINRIPSRSLDFHTPFDTLNHSLSSPLIPNLPPKVFGCIAFVHIPKHTRHKLQPCALRCVFVGYGLHQKGYRCFHPPTQKLYVTMDVKFHEHQMYFPATETTNQGEESFNIQSLSHQTENISHSLPEPETPEQEPVEPEHMDAVIEPTTLELQPCDQPNIAEATVPQQQSSPLDASIPHESPSTDESQVNLEPPLRILPNRITRGIPRVSYEPVRTSTPKYPLNNYVSYHRLSKACESFANQLSTVHVPNSVQEAIKDPRWKNAMNEEMKSLQRNATWEVIDLPAGKKPVGCRWIFSVKYKADGDIERFKARLVAKGYSQTYGIDYAETFAPVAKINTVRILLSLAANFDWPLHQFDVKNAFLHGNLQEEVYMELPPGCQLQVEGSKQVCKLRKSLYGLKQSPRAWFGRFTNSMKAFGYQQSSSDHTLFIKHKEGKLTILIIYVDDMIVTGNDSVEKESLQTYLSREFEMKDLGPLKYFLGIEVLRSRHGILLSQRKYTIDLLNEVGMLACKPSDTPAAENVKLSAHSNQIPANKEQYQRLVGRLMYLAHTRPDLAYLLSVVSRYMHSPSEEHMKAIMRILQYLKSSPGKGIMFTKGDTLNIEGYTDADWAGSIDDRRSTAGYLTFVGGNLVTWRSKKQGVVARSSAEAEYRGMAKGVCELLWIKNLLQELKISSTFPMKLYCDNKAACDIAHNPVQHDRTKHVEIDRHFIKEQLEAKIIAVPHVRSQDQLADILTKAVSSKAFHQVLDKLGMKNIHAPT
jgi:hypothetical protein